jgi:hypothetical protein
MLYSHATEHTSVGSKKLLAVSSNERSVSTKAMHACKRVCVFVLYVCMYECSYSWITVGCTDYITCCISMCTCHWNWYVLRKVLQNSVSLFACLGMGPLRWIKLTKLTHTLNIFHQLLLVKKHILEDGSTSYHWGHRLAPSNGPYSIYFILPDDGGTKIFQTTRFLTTITEQKIFNTCIS